MAQGSAACQNSSSDEEKEYTHEKYERIRGFWMNKDVRSEVQHAAEGENFGQVSDKPPESKVRRRRSSPSRLRPSNVVYKTKQRQIQRISAPTAAGNDSTQSLNGASRASSTSDVTKTERAEIFLRTQAEKLQDRNKYKSMFDDRVGLDYEEMQDVLRISLVEEEDDDETAVAADGDKKVQQAKTKTTKEQGEDELTGRFTGSGGPGRTLWRNMQEVEASGLLSKLSKDEIKLQEAQFEVITTEATYYKSLMVVIDVFYKSPLFDHTRPNATVRAFDKHHLFSNIVDIFDCSATFLKALEDEWKKSVIMDSVSQVILDHIEKLKVYKDYCRNFYYQTKTLEKLRSNPEFVAQLTELERRPDCRMIPLQSYLEMPMKRAMSLQLLMDAVMRRMPENTPRYSNGMRALGQLLSLARECDQESRMMSEKEQMLKLQNLLSFSKVKKVGCWGGNRHLIKEGQMRVINAVPNTQGFMSKMSLRKSYLQLHAFSDLLIVSKPKADQGFQVLKHCPRSFVDADCAPIQGGAGGSGGGGGLGGSTGSLQRLTLRLRILDRSDGTPEVTLLLEPKSRDDADRWLMIFSPRDELGDPVYDPDDCPQAKVVKAHKAQQKDDLELREGEIVNIYKKTDEGWLLGSRLADPNVRGWFLASHVREIENDHYRAKLRKVSFRRKNAIAMYARNKSSDA